MAEVRKATIEAIKEGLGYSGAKAKVITVDGVEITVKRDLSLSERSSMIQDIVKMVFRETNDGQTVYAPYLRDIAFDYNILHYFTDIDLSANASEIYDFVLHTHIMSDIADVVRDGYIDDILRDADDLIKFNRDKLANRTKVDELFDSLSGLIKLTMDKVSDANIGEMFEKAISDGLAGGAADGDISEAIKSILSGGISAAE
jgi:hypothetical protein